MTEKKQLKVNCPTCNQSVEWSEEAKFRPFCSERCQQVDLGAWSTEAYKIPSEPTEEWSEDDRSAQGDSPQAATYSTIH